MQLVRVSHGEGRALESAAGDCAEQRLWSLADYWERDNDWSECAGCLCVVEGDGAVAVAANASGEGALVFDDRPLAFLVLVQVPNLA